MTYKTTYWDEVDGVQKERDCTPEETVEIEARKAAALVPPVPLSISPRQIRQALTAAGLRDPVESAVAAGSQDLKDWWGHATEFERQHPLVLSMAQALGVSSEQLDQLWILGGGL